MRWTRSTSSETAPAPSPARPVAGPSPQIRRLSGPAGFWESVRRLLPSVRTAMEYCWLYPWIVVIGGGLYGGADPLIGPGWAFILMLGGQLAVSPVLARVGPLPRARAVLITGGLLLGFVAVHERHYPAIPLWSPAWLGALLRAAHDALPSVPKPALGALVAACLWWRGLALGARETDALAIDAAYKTGVGMIVLYFIAAAVYADTQGFLAAGPTLPGSLPAFFFMGLSALALARLSIIWDRGQPDERAHFPARAWVLLVIGIVGLILLAASMSAVMTYVGVGLRPLLPVVEVLFLVLFFVAEILVRVIIAILSRIPRRTPDPLQPPPPTVFDDLLRRLREINMHPQVIEGARWLMVVTVVALLAVGMALAVVLMRRRERKSDDDEHESVWSSQDALGGLKRFMRRLRFRRHALDEPREPGARSIRRVYRELLRLGARIGAPRHPSMTPREHDPRLRAVLPVAAQDVTALTDLYERVRYGDWQPPVADVRTAQDTLGRIKAAVGSEVAGGTPPAG